MTIIVANEKHDQIAEVVKQLLGNAFEDVNNVIREANEELGDGAIQYDVHLQAFVRSDGINPDDDSDQSTHSTKVVCSDDGSGIDAMMMGAEMFTRRAQEYASDDANQLTQEHAIAMLQRGGRSPSQYRSVAERLQNIVNGLNHVADLADGGQDDDLRSILIAAVAETSGIDPEQTKQIMRECKDGDEFATRMMELASQNSQQPEEGNNE